MMRKKSACIALPVIQKRTANGKISNDTNVLPVENAFRVESDRREDVWFFGKNMFGENKP
jgi:hypothetical protein